MSHHPSVGVELLLDAGGPLAWVAVLNGSDCFMRLMMDGDDDRVGVFYFSLFYFQKTPDFPKSVRL